MKLSASSPSYFESPSLMDDIIGEENFFKRDEVNFEGISAEASFLVFDFFDFRFFHYNFVLNGGA